MNAQSSVEPNVLEIRTAFTFNRQFHNGGTGLMVSLKQGRAEMAAI